MEKFKKVLLTAIICAIVFLIISFWIFEYEWSILPYLLLTGCFMAWVQAETAVYKFLDKLLIGSLLFGFLAMILIFLKRYMMSHLVYDSPLPLAELWDKDTLMMAAVFSLVSFLGGLLGVVLKGFYALYKNKLGILVVFVGPLAVLSASLAVYKIKIGGTIMSAQHGWPYPFWIHQIKDVLDNFTIDEWIFSPGSLYHYIIFDYLFYLLIFVLFYFLVKSVNARLRMKKINITIALFSFLVFMVLIFISFLSIKKSYISRQIAWAGECRENSDCAIVANRSPFSCAIVVNKANADRILNLVNSFPSTGELQCSGREKAVCLENKCWVSIEQTPEDINDVLWQRIKQSIKNCEVGSTMQTHSLEVTAVLKTGEVIKAFEPKIDDIFEITDKVKDKCGEIRTATE
ncbi:MAG: hypothetical protein PHZ04_01455 [Patescibacteria group bacterium]|nr:hypothetical protein [Patescibacteria group bacterium]MDD5294996.1 hypothetical protein [Patescibacteria group bacterium]MDD5554355.1 hypothetical protein [Patescibacteria group bacterium]